MSSNNSDLKNTPLFHEHVALGGRMVAFAGWNMPVQYEGVVAEHHTVRKSVGLFDVSHMGELHIEGRKSLEFLQKMTINDVSKMSIGQAQYNAFCYENGTIVDDIIIYKRGYEQYLVCVNASNVQKDFIWLQDHLPTHGVILEDISEEYAQIAVQGPHSDALVARVVDIKMDGIPYYGFAEGKVLGIPSIIARTGYTGERGYELYIPASTAAQVWRGLLHAGADLGVKPCGLGARDTLRLEAGYLLYGNDMDQTSTALECGLGWILKFDKGDFIGKEALIAQQAKGLSRRLVGFEMCDKAIGRHGYFVYRNIESSAPMGVVTSGSPAPSLSKNIGFL